jgi:hypothetical protein
MRKPLLIALVGIAGLLAMLFFTRSQKSANTVVKQGTNEPVKPKPENIDSLMTLIRKDPRYPIRDVIFAHNDSSLIIFIAGEKCSTRYFDTTYHISTLQFIDGLKIYDTHNRGLDSYSKKGNRLIGAFRDKWCLNNECQPLTTRIEQGMIPTENYHSLKLWVDWVGDSSFYVTNLFHLKNSTGGVKTRWAHAQIDMNGKISVYDVTR